MEPFREFGQLERLLERLSPYARIGTQARVPEGKREFPLYTIVLGSQAPDAPVFGLTGGVHGIEKIGTQVVISYLEHLLERLPWDESLQWQLQRIRIALMPIVNPIGMKRLTRCNGNGVDLNRNAPVEAEKATPLVGGHRMTKLLPWHRGVPGKMEVEAQALCDFVQRESFASPQSVWIDVHSGFGIVDQLWFPYAKSKLPFPNLAEVSGLKMLLDRVLPNHVYKFEPQAIHYTTHGDLWDHLYDEYLKLKGAHARSGSQIFVPLTLELGSWNWVKKNPFQIFSLLGHYNPIKPHRKRRALRRHLPLFDFLIQAVSSPSAWKGDQASQRELFLEKALQLWYPGISDRLLPELHSA